MQKHVKNPRTIASREFNQDIGKAKRAAEEGPVVITDRGRPAYVLMKHEDYRAAARQTAEEETLFDLLDQTRRQRISSSSLPRMQRRVAASRTIAD